MLRTDMLIPKDTILSLAVITSQGKLKLNNFDQCQLLINEFSPGIVWEEIFSSIHDKLYDKLVLENLDFSLYLACEMRPLLDLLQLVPKEAIEFLNVK